MAFYSHSPAVHKYFVAAPHFMLESLCFYRAAAENTVLQNHFTGCPTGLPPDFIAAGDFPQPAVRHMEQRRKALPKIVRPAFQVGVFRPHLGQLEAQEPGALTSFPLHFFCIRPFTLAVNKMPCHEKGQPAAEPLQCRTQLIHHHSHHPLTPRSAADTACCPPG